MTARERIWRNIREAAASYEAPDHLSDQQLLMIAKRLWPLGPGWADDAELFGMTSKEWNDAQTGDDL